MSSPFTLPYVDKKHIEERTADELEDLLSIVQTEIIRIKSQLEFAEMHLDEYGEEYDPDWYVSAKTALRYRAKEEQDVRRALGKRRKQDNIAQSVSEDRRFRIAAHKVLDEYTFNKILCKVEEMVVQDEQ